jgi:hypothetical protein
MSAESTVQDARRAGADGVYESSHNAHPPAGIDYSAFNFVPVLGLCGSGKSESLACMRDGGHQVICPEELAGIKGVCLADMFGDALISQADFDQRVNDALLALDPGERVMFEWKSPNVMGLRFDPALVTAIRQAPAFFYETTHESRVARLVSQYDAWAEATDLLIVRLMPRIGVIPGLVGKLERSASLSEFVGLLLTEWLDPEYQREIDRFRVEWRGCF